MDALGTLMEEHEVILYAIRVLGESTAKLKSGKDVPKKFHDDFLDIMSNFADRCHHGKEETVLFPLMEKRDPTLHDTVSALFADHQKGRIFLAGLRDAAAVNDVKGIVENSEGYADLLKAHIQKENFLFPEWMKLLSDVDSADVFERFEAIEEEVIGKGKHAEYEVRVKNLLSLIH